jgi:protein-arginine kinase activator protein McsA
VIYVCPNCGKTFESAEELKSVSCYRCGYTWKTHKQYLLDRVLSKLAFLLGVLMVFVVWGLIMTLRK